MEKTYRIEYWEHTSTTIDVVAASEEEALEKAKKRLSVANWIALQWNLAIVVTS